ncbi:MAG: RidA family protein [Acidobacteria bacterium]|jgi:2-iminobutanoate/2-iminopropanoate deaminase|nr:RidA family protein [Acidobacteriota bacterium]
MKTLVAAVAPLALTLLVAGGCASGSEARRVITAPGAPAAIGPYSHAVEADDTLWVSGQVGIDPATGQMVPGGIEAETRQALKNLEAVLKAAGYSARDVVQAQVFLADMNDFAAMNAIYAEVFKSEPPARATVQVARLPKDARIEIACTAVRR